MNDNDSITFGNGFWFVVEPDEDVRQAMCTMITKALAKCFLLEKDRLRTIVYKYDNWRLQLGPHPPATVPPQYRRLRCNAVQMQTETVSTPSSEILRELNSNEKLGKLVWVFEKPSNQGRDRLYR